AWRVRRRASACGRRGCRTWGLGGVRLDPRRSRGRTNPVPLGTCVDGPLGPRGRVGARDVPSTERGAANREIRRRASRPPMRSACVEVPVERGEEVRRRLLEMDALRRDLRIERSGDRLYLPVTIPVDIGLPVLEREFPAGFTLVRSYRDLVHIPPRLAPLLPKAFDEIGDIVVLRLPEELVGFEREIGEAILRWSPKVCTVAADEGVGGELRIRKVRVIAGEARTRTEHVEFGLRYLVDVERAYFSPRLGSERSRVADQVNAGRV